VPKPVRGRSVSRSEARAYLAKADQYLSAAVDSLAADRTIAATSLAIHAAINAADAVIGARLGSRAAGEDHNQVLVLLDQSGPDGATVARDLTRLLPLKTRAEYDPDDVAPSIAAHAVERARRCVAAARRAISSL
jgi:uncharacterized protein YbjQ (UPF0145 family)